MADTCVRSNHGKKEEVLPVIDGPFIDHPSYPTPKQYLMRQSKDTAKAVTEEEEAMQKCDVSICDHQGKQERVGERLPR